MTVTALRSHQRGGDGGPARLPYPQVASSRQEGGPEPDPGRWRPSRAGILNVWRYYDETFQFHRGRLLLRGANGTGKSKALELLLPFLLDANLRPSRLSTFGGSERTMHWNLIGHGWDGTNRVGYVWIEFHRTDPAGGDQWFTCGARLAATSNTRTVTAAYFTTTLRVGLPGGLRLVSEDGRPLARAALAQAVGDANVRDSGAEHRRAVRQALFRDLPEDAYDALITTLLQLRIPKLSEHLDPGELSRILSRSLPPLDHGDIAEIAEGFEKLDRRKEALAQLATEVEQAKQLAARQRTYARRVLRAAAADLISATTRMDAATRQARQRREELDAAAAEQGRLEDEDRHLARTAHTVEQQVAGLKDSDAYKEGQQLAVLRQEVAQSAQRARAARAAATSRAADAEADSRAAGEAATAARQATEAAGRAESEARAGAARVGLDGAVEEAIAADGLDRARLLLRATIEARHRQIEQVRSALRQHGAAVQQRDAGERRREQRASRLEAARQAQRERDEARGAALDRLRGDLAAWATACQVLPLRGRIEELAALAEREPELLALVAAAAEPVRDELARREQDLSARRSALAGERGGHAAALAELAANKPLVPDAPHTRTADRAALPGAPLWRLVGWAPGVDDGTQARVEAALEAAGLLDALVLPGGSVRVEGHDTFADARLGLPAPGRSLADILIVEPDGPVPAGTVTRLLAGIAFGATAFDPAPTGLPNPQVASTRQEDRSEARLPYPQVASTRQEGGPEAPTDSVVPGGAAAPGHPAAVGADGSWRLGSARGTWDRPEARFIGAAARERARQRRMAELRALIADLDDQLSGVGEALDAVAARRALLAEEQRRRPPHTALADADRRLAQAIAHAATCADALDEAEAEVAAADVQVAKALRALTASASGNRLPSSAKGLDAVADALRGFDRLATTWVDLLVSGKGLVALAEQRVAAAKRSREQADDAAAQARSLDTEAAGYQAKLDQVERAVGASYREVLDRIRGLEEELRSLRARREALTDERLHLVERVGSLKARLAEDEHASESATTARDQAAGSLRRLRDSGLVTDASLRADPGALETVTAALQAARQVAAELSTTPYEPRLIKEAEARLTETVHEVQQALAGHADLVLEPDDDGRLVLGATVEGLRMGSTALHASLVAERDRAQGELTADEQELFDEILTGSARRLVADRIRLADQLVRDMNAQLAQVTTASRLRVRLRWQVDPELPPGTREARDLLLRDPASLPQSDRAALHQFFRARIDEVRAANAATGWEQQLLQVLDYTAWHQFVVQADKQDGNGWAEVTKRRHAALSGGEKAIVLHLPLFAAAAAHYRAASEAPRLILLDEVFVGVDSANRGQLLRLLGDFDLDLVLTSDHEWCTYAELGGIAIHQLITGADDDAVTTARFVWDGTRVHADDSPGDPETAPDWRDPPGSLGANGRSELPSSADLKDR